MGARERKCSKIAKKISTEKEKFQRDEIHTYTSLAMMFVEMPK